MTAVPERRHFPPTWLRCLLSMLALLTLGLLDTACSQAASATTSTVTTTVTCAHVCVLQHPVGAQGLARSDGPVELGHGGRHIRGAAVDAPTARFVIAAEGGLATESNLATVTTHLDSIDALASHPPNAAMVGRIQDAMSSGRALTPGEQNFMTHELTEADLMSRGVGQDLAHEMAGQTHPTFGNYDPEVIKQFPEYFNSNWRAYWGIP